MASLWPVPVRRGAEEPRVFALPLKAEWVPRSAAAIKRMRDLRPHWMPLILHRLVRRTQQAVLPLARRYLSQHYHFEGHAARSLRITGLGGTSTKAHVDVGSTLKSFDRAYGRWATEPFIYPWGLHEGIKSHYVYIRRHGMERRPHLEAWARRRGLTAPRAGRDWRIRVYKRGRRASGKPFLLDAITDAREDFADSIASSLLGAISGTRVGRTPYILNRS